MTINSYKPGTHVWLIDDLYGYPVEAIITKTTLQNNVPYADLRSTSILSDGYVHQYYHPVSALYDTMENCLIALENLTQK